MVVGLRTVQICAVKELVCSRVQIMPNNASSNNHNELVLFDFVSEEYTRVKTQEEKYLGTD